MPSTLYTGREGGGGRYSVAEEFVQLSEVSVIRDLRSAVDGQADHRDGNQDCFVTNS